MLLKLFKDDKALNNFFLIYKIDWIENVHRLLKGFCYYIIMLII